MSDKQHNPAPDEKPAGEDAFSGLAGPNIDDLLAEAESLAGNLAHEVGIAEESSAPASAPTPPEKTNPMSASPAANNPAEAALAAMQAVLTEDEDRTENADTHECDPATQEALPTDRPTTLEPATDPAPEDATPPSPSEPPVTPDDHAVVDEEIAAAASHAATATKPEAESNTVVTSAQPAASGRIRRALRRIGGGVKSAPRLIASAPGWTLLGLLWLLDAPFAWMSPSLKAAIGYIGVVTAVMAAVAWAMVFFGYGG